MSKMELNGLGQLNHCIWLTISSSSMGKSDSLSLGWRPVQDSMLPFVNRLSILKKKINRLHFINTNNHMQSFSYLIRFVIIFRIYHYLFYVLIYCSSFFEAFDFFIFFSNYLG